LDRRDLLALAGLAALAPELGRAADAPAGEVPTSVRLVRVWADAAGESHIQELTIPSPAPPLPPMTARIRPEGPPASAHPPRWHNGPKGAFAINLAGDLDVQASDGSKAYVPLGGIAYLEDAAGKGHLTMPRHPVTLLFLTPPDGFDVVAWCAGAAPKP
jgi:hypothetical protein